MTVDDAVDNPIDIGAVSSGASRSWRTATGPMPVMTSRSGTCCAQQAVAAVLGLEIGMLREDEATSGLHGFDKYATRPIAKNL